MKELLISAIVALCLIFTTTVASRHETQCENIGAANDVNLRSPIEECKCSEVLIEQVYAEFEASFTYLAMAARFKDESYYRPGVAKFFMDSANEERGHGKAIMKYALMRGFKDVAAPLKTIEVNTTIINRLNVLEAMRTALALEEKVTANISNIIQTCDRCNDNQRATVYNIEYHISDYMTGDFLTEQLEGMRKIGEYIATLELMRGSDGILKELLFDKSLRG